MAARTKTEIKPVYLIWGSDEYEVGQKARALVESLCPPAEQAFGLETIDGKGDTIDAAVAAVNQCLEAIRTIGFFGASKTIWLRDATFLAPKRESAGEEADESEESDEKGDGVGVKDRLNVLAAEIKKGLPEGQRLVISAIKVNKTWAIYKAIKEAGEIIEFNPPDKGYQAEQATGEYVRNAFREAGLKTEDGVLEEFLDRTGGDTRQIRNEIEKLSLYLLPRKEVRLEDVRAIVSASREAAAWDLADAFGKRDLVEALAILRHLLAQKEAPQFIMATLEGRIRDLIMYRHCLDRRWLRINRSGSRIYSDWALEPEGEAWISALPRDPRKIHPYRISMLAEQASRYGFEELLRAHRLTTDAHERMQSSSVPADVLMEHLLVATMPKGPRATR